MFFSVSETAKLLSPCLVPRWNAWPAALLHSDLDGSEEDHAPARRSAAVGVLAAEVYVIAGWCAASVRVRGRRLCALSPAHAACAIAMYQAGEVDYLVATTRSAWASTLTSHVAFAQLGEFDGGSCADYPGPNSPIAGRAGGI